MLLSITPIFANADSITEISQELSQETKGAQDSEEKFILKTEKTFQPDKKLEYEIEELKKEVVAKDGEFQFDDSKYVLLKDKNGKRFIIDKKYQKIVKDPASVDLSESRATIPDIFKKITENETPDEKLEQPSQEEIAEDMKSPEAVVLRACGDGTGPIGDCKVQYYDEDRVVTKKQYLRTEFRPDIEIIGDIPVPVIKEVDICYIMFKKYRIANYRCEFQGCVTYTKGPKELVGEFSSADLNCNDLPDVGKHF